MTVRVALDLLGGDHAPSSVVDGALLALRTLPDVSIVLVGPADLAGRLLAARGAAGSVDVVPASEVVGMDEDPARALRTKRDATVRVAAELVRDDRADVLVSTGATGATLAAAVLTLGRLTTRPALAVVVPAVTGPVVLLDIGATAEATVAHLVQHAVLGSAYAEVLGIDAPRVGLLNVGEEPGKGDQLRKDAFAALSDAPVRFVGNVEGQDVTLGGPADVVVTDGFTGNILLKGIEGATARAGRRDLPVSALLLGVDGVCVVGHGSSGPEEVAACVAMAVRSHTESLVPRLKQVLDGRRAPVSR